MYAIIKGIAKSILPISFLRSNDTLIRSIVSLPYRGSRYQCNVCSIKLKKFITLPTGDLLCPKCGSRPRGRRLYRHLQDEQLLYGSVLHFSPPKCLYDRLKGVQAICYYPTDFENEFTADYHFDIKAIDLPENSIDLIICYHVLEHIDNDILAMSELSRVLKQSGKAIIQTPFKEGAIYEDDSIRTEAEREIAFGQKDHVRIYSKESLAQRLKDNGFKIQIHNYKEDTAQYNGLRSETVIIASI